MLCRGFLLVFLVLVTGCSDGATHFLRSGAGDEPDSDGTGTPDNGDDGEPGGPGAGPGGHLGIGYWAEVPDSGEYATGGGAGFGAQFTNEVTKGIAGTSGIEWNSPGDPDSCAVTVWNEADNWTEGGVPGESEPLHAGALTLTGPSWSIEMEPAWEGGEFQYTAELNPDFELHFDTYYGLSASGGTFPAFESSEALLVPDPVFLLDPHPDDGFDVTHEDFTIEWTGGDAEELHLEFHNGGGREYNNVQIQCRPLNDGSFTIPGNMIALFGNEDLLRLMLSQTRNVDLVVGDLVVDIASASSTGASGTAW